jgi:hypothetical protein
MRLIKKYWIPVAVLLPILILVVHKTFSPENFKYDARKWAESSLDKSNLVSRSDIYKLPGNKLIINLDGTHNEFDDLPKAEITIPPDSILEKKYFDKIKGNKGPVILSSSDKGLSARIWMLISQTGRKNIYILTPDIDNEVFKYKFRPDTITKTEF